MKEMPCMFWRRIHVNLRNRFFLHHLDIEKQKAGISEDCLNVTSPATQSVE
jgi:hypothetical protein